MSEDSEEAHRTYGLVRLSRSRSGCSANREPRKGERAICDLPARQPNSSARSLPVSIGQRWKTLSARLACSCLPAGDCPVESIVRARSRERQNAAQPKRRYRLAIGLSWGAVNGNTEMAAGFLQARSRFVQSQNSCVTNDSPPIRPPRRLRQRPESCNAECSRRSDPKLTRLGHLSRVHGRDHRFRGSGGVLLC